MFLKVRYCPRFILELLYELKDWEQIYETCKQQKLDLVTDSKFLEGKAGEHMSFFIKDPNDYMVEFKSFKNAESIFKK